MPKNRNPLKNKLNQIARRRLIFINLSAQKNNELKNTVSRVQEGRKSWRDEAINARRQPTHMSKKRNSWQGETLQAKKDLEKNGLARVRSAVLKAGSDRSESTNKEDRKRSRVLEKKTSPISTRETEVPHQHPESDGWHLANSCETS